MTLTGDSTLVDSNFETPPQNPLLMLQSWLEVTDKLGVIEPGSVVLSTVNPFGRPSSRVVLLKACDDTGVIFGTSQNSAKGKDLALNPWAAGTLWWHETIQQVNFQGRVTQLSPKRSDELFHARMRGAQGVTAASQQSAPLTDEKDLKDKVRTILNTKGPIARPESWHGYHLMIESIEFWHGGQDRFHKRLRYDLINGSWHSQKLQP